MPAKTKRKMKVENPLSKGEVISVPFTNWKFKVGELLAVKKHSWIYIVSVVAPGDNDHVAGDNVVMKVQVSSKKTVWEIPTERYIMRMLGRLIPEDTQIQRCLCYGRINDDVYVLVSDMLGRDLSVLVKDAGSFPASHAMRAVLSVCTELRRMHDVGVLHRDIKPDNILLPPLGKGRLYLLDFGISKRMTSTSTVYCMGYAWFHCARKNMCTNFRPFF